MTAAIRAEWTKLLTIRELILIAVGAVLLTIGVTALVDATTQVHGGSPVDPVKLSLAGVDVGQAIVALLGVQIMTTEYSTGLIVSSLSAVPQRARLFASKAIVLIAVASGSAVVAIVGCLAVGDAILHGRGAALAPGYPTSWLTAESTMRAAVGTLGYLVLIALLGLGIGTVVREAATAAGVVLGVLYMFPIAAALVTDPHWSRHLTQIGPMTAGLSMQTTVDLSSLPIGPWPGLGVVALWAGGALVIGAVLLHARDA